MAGTAVISDVFEIVWDQTAAQGNHTIANPGRAFRVIGCFGTGANNSVMTIKKNDNGGDLICTITMENAGLGASLTDQAGIMSATASQHVLTGGDNIYIAVTAADCTRVVIQCVAAAGYALNVT